MLTDATALRTGVWSTCPSKCGSKDPTTIPYPRGIGPRGPSYEARAHTGDNEQSNRQVEVIPTGRIRQCQAVDSRRDGFRMHIAGDPHKAPSCGPAGDVD